MHKYFNPRKFARIAHKMLPYSVALTLLTLAFGLYYALFASPADYQQGESVRIMYVHVPAAWMSLFIYSNVALCAAASLIWKNPLSDIIAIACAYIGACFTAVCLVTGALWGKPIWGAWWVWDARLTSVLILFFFYIGYIVLYNSYEDKQKAGKLAAILALVGFINIPIVKFSVNWWNTLHQPASIMRSGGISIDPAMLTPLFLMFMSFMLLFVSIMIVRIKTDVNMRKIEREQRIY